MHTMKTYGIPMLALRDKVVPFFIPCYPAETHNSLERGSRPYSVVEILREVFKEDFQKAIQYYMDICPEGAAAGIGVQNKEAKDFKLKWLSEPRVESALHQPACATAVDLVFRAVVEALVPVDSSTEEALMERRRFWANYRMRYMIALWDKQCSAPIIAPVEYFPSDMITEQKTSITNQYLLPIMYAEDYAKAGRKMLERYYKEALDKPTAVDGWELAKRMKLHVRKVRFEAGSDIQGRIYFDWTWVELKDENGIVRKERIAPMTVLINKDLCRTAEVENSTIIHECCHVYLDLPFFKLQMLSGKPYTSYTSRKRTKRKYTQDNSPIDWMELQAEKLPAYVLMEESNTRCEIERLLTLRCGICSPENMYWIMTQLASTFKVSRSMAKYRMIELGYPEAEGVYTFIDNERIPDYGCGGTWKRGITYAIALSDIGVLARKSPYFAKALQSGYYTYAEGHLTAYARRHIEECCISFTVQGRYTNAAYEDAQAARKTPVKNRYQSRHDFIAEPETKQRVKENEIFSSDSAIWMKLKTSMPETVGGAIQKILDEKGITQQELAMRLGVSRAALNKWSSCRMSKRHIVAICIALDVRGDIGLELVRLTGQTLLNNMEDNLLTAMLYETRDLTVGRANEIMRQQKLAPLTEGQDEELVC